MLRSRSQGATQITVAPEESTPLVLVSRSSQDLGVELQLDLRFRDIFLGIVKSMKYTVQEQRESYSATEIETGF